MTFDLDSTLPDTREQVIDWINGSLDNCMPENLQDISNEVILKLISQVDQLQWQLQHGCMQLAVSYENTLRKYTNLLPHIHQKLRDMQLGRGRGGELIAEWEEYLEEAQNCMAEITGKLSEGEMAKMGQLLEHKSIMEKQLKSHALIEEWETKVESIRNALSSNNIDAAEELLKELDVSFEENWNEDEDKGQLLREIRSELVQLINSQ